MFDMLNNVGSLLLLFSTLPQFYLAWKNRRKLRDISLTSYLGQSSACAILTVWTLFNQLYFMTFLEIGFGIYASSMVYLALKRRLAKCRK